MAYGTRMLLVLLLYHSVVDLAIGQDPTIRGVQYSLELLGDDLRSVQSLLKVCLHRTKAKAKAVSLSDRFLGNQTCCSH